MDSFFNYDFNDISQFCLNQGTPAVHARALYRSVYKEMALKPWLVENLPKKLSEASREAFSFSGLEIAEEQCSKYDRTVKFLFELKDGHKIETVLIPEKGRVTLCVSSQVGCRQACSFCHTGRMGLLRHLEASEIVAQVVVANRWLKNHPDWLPREVHAKNCVSNIVFMGMGEPFDNVPALKKAIRILINPLGLGVAPKKISVSTAGHIDGMRQFRKEFPKIPIAISLHSANAATRQKLMPIQSRWGLEDLKNEIRSINQEAGMTVLVQYTLIAGVNDSETDADELADFLEGLSVKVNLIPFNDIAPSLFKGPTDISLAAFRDLLYERGLRVMVRFSKGQDIAAACGQLFESSLGEAAN